MKHLVGLILVVSLAACGGGGGGGSLPPPVTPGTPAGGSPPPSATPSPTSSPTSSPTASPSPAALQITANVPLNDSQNYSQSPQFFGVRLLSVNGAAQNIVTTQATTCTATSCQVGITAPVGTDTFAITYAVFAPTTMNPNYRPLLAYQGPFSISVAANTTNTASVNLIGVPAYYELDATGNSPWSAAMPLSMHFVDAAATNWCTPSQVTANNCTPSVFMHGAFANPITLTDTDTSGQTALVVNNGAPTNTVTITQAADTVSLRIKAGANVTQAYVTPSGAFSAAQFGANYSSTSLQPWFTQDVNGLGFTCTNGACKTTGPSSVTIQ